VLFRYSLRSFCLLQLVSVTHLRLSVVALPVMTRDSASVNTTLVAKSAQPVHLASTITLHARTVSVIEAAASGRAVTRLVLNVTAAQTTPV